MNRYVIKFTKQGYIKYTSHLDLLRLFKRAFKKVNISLAYSQGFNPHPKLSFAQPLSLGYSSTFELIEIETQKEYDPKTIIDLLNSVMPKGLIISECNKFDNPCKSIAAACNSAEYIVDFPVAIERSKIENLICEYLKQDEIITEKRQKKTKKIVPVNIKSKIKAIDIVDSLPELLTLKLSLDCGSVSNLSPELVINSFLQFTNLQCSRNDVEVTRIHLGFSSNLNF